MSLDKKLNKIFNQEASLENEDWLSLDDNFYSNIENQIVEKPKKKKRFFFIILGIGILLSIAFLVMYFMLSSTQILGQNASKTSSHQETSISNNEYNYKKNNSATNNYSSSESADTTVKIVSNRNKDLEKTDISSSIQIHKNAKSGRPHLVGKKENIFLGLLIPKNKSIAPNKTLINKNNDQVPSQSNLKKKEYNDKIISIDIYPEAYIKHQELDTLQNNVAIQQIIIPRIKPLSDKSWYWKVSTGYTYGMLKHSIEYRLALEPAAYRNSKYSSTEIDFTFAKRFKSNLALYTTIGFGISTFTSGHNANLDYSIDNEVNMSNNLAINMATPLGFVSSEIVVTRENASIPGGLIQMDLHNQHQLKELFVELGLEYTWFKNNHFSVSTMSGVGNRYTMDITNSLSKIDFSEKGYRFNSKVDESIPSYINRNRWYSSFGLSGNYLINNNSEIKLLTAYRYQFNNLYQNDAFRVRMIDFKFSLSFLKFF